MNIIVLSILLSLLGQVLSMRYGWPPYLIDRYADVYRRMKFDPVWLRMRYRDMIDGDYEIDDVNDTEKLYAWRSDGPFRLARQFGLRNELAS